MNRLLGYQHFFFEIEPSVTRMNMGSDRGGAQIYPEGEGVGQVLACKIVFILQSSGSIVFVLSLMLEIL